jgi:hypothetical protein
MAVEKDYVVLFFFYLKKVLTINCTEFASKEQALIWWTHIK